MTVTDCWRSRRSLCFRVLVDVIHHACLNTRRNPLEIILALKRPVDILGTEEISNRRLINEVHCRVIANVVSGSRVGRGTVDPQVTITQAGAEFACPVVCESKLPGAGWSGDQVTLGIKSHVGSQTEVIVVVVRDSLSENELKLNTVFFERKSPDTGERLTESASVPI